MTSILHPADAVVAAALGIPVDAVDAGARDRWARGAWSCLIEPGDGVAGALIAAFEAEAALAVLGDGRPDAPEAGIDAATLAGARKRWGPRLTTLADGFAAARRCGARLLTPADTDWPHRVDALGVHAPVCLWVRGAAGRLRAEDGAVAIVGARAATAYGEQMAAELAGGLAASGVTVVSGAAYGIDGAAHRAALRSGGPTIAVLAGGIDRPYPAGHVRLLDEIARDGVVTAEVPCGTAPTKWRFLARNRLIAAMADATVVVEAGWRSGSLNTAHHAAELGRPLGAVPGPVTSAGSQGCHRLLREADAVCITGVHDVVELAGFGPGSGGGPATTGGRTDDATRVCDALSTRTARTVDDVARRSGMAPGEVQAVLGLLDLEGAVERCDDRWRRRRSG